MFRSMFVTRVLGIILPLSLAVGCAGESESADDDGNTLPSSVGSAGMPSGGKMQTDQGGRDGGGGSSSNTGTPMGGQAMSGGTSTPPMGGSNNQQMMGNDLSQCGDLPTYVMNDDATVNGDTFVSYTHLTLPTILLV